MVRDPLLAVVHLHDRPAAPDEEIDHRGIEAHDLEEELAERRLEGVEQRRQARVEVQIVRGVHRRHHDPAVHQLGLRALANRLEDALAGGDPSPALWGRRADALSVALALFVGVSAFFSHYAGAFGLRVVLEAFIILPLAYWIEALTYAGSASWVGFVLSARRRPAAAARFERSSRGVFPRDRDRA